MKLKTIILIVILIVILFSVIFFFAFGTNSSFYSNTCNSKPIPIVGEFIYRDQLVKELQIIEQDCDYLNFIAENVNVIYALNPGMMNAGEYHPGSFEIYADPFASSEHISAAIIIHETCHAYQDKIKSGFSEEDCTTTEYNFLKNINAPKKDIIQFEKRNESYYALLGYTTTGKDVFLDWNLTRN